MNKYLIIASFLLFISLVVLIMPDIVSAQAPPPPPNKPAQSPIDGGLGLLAAAGGAYAIKKMRDRKK